MSGAKAAKAAEESRPAEPPGLWATIKGEQGSWFVMNARHVGEGGSARTQYLLAYGAMDPKWIDEGKIGTWELREERGQPAVPGRCFDRRDGFVLTVATSASSLSR